MINMFKWYEDYDLHETTFKKMNLWWTYDLLTSVIMNQQIINENAKEKNRRVWGYSNEDIYKDERVIIYMMEVRFDKDVQRIPKNYLFTNDNVLSDNYCALVYRCT